MSVKLPSASATKNGIMLDTTQTIAGAKTFTGTLTISNATDPGMEIIQASSSGHLKLTRTGSAAGSVYLTTASGDLRFGTTAGATDIGNASAGGTWTFGSTNGSQNHIMNGTTLTLGNGTQTSVFLQFEKTGGTTADWRLGTNDTGLSGSNTGGFNLFEGVGSKYVAQCTQAGAWTFGPAVGGVTHTINGAFTQSVSTSSTAVTLSNTNSSGGTLSVTGTATTSGVNVFLVNYNTSTVGWGVRGNGQLQANNTNWGTGGTAIGISAGLITASPSSNRYKENIVALNTEIDTSKIFDLVPVVFDYIEVKGGQHSFGLIAEDTYTILPCLVNQEKDSETEELRPESVSYDHLSVLVLAELKKLRNEFDAYIEAHP